MTCDDFYLDIRGSNVEIIAKDCSMKVEMDVCYEDFTHALLHSNDNLDYIADPLKEELIQRAVNEWDFDQISEGELNIFKKVLEVIL